VDAATLSKLPVSRQRKPQSCQSICLIRPPRLSEAVWCLTALKVGTTADSSCIIHAIVLVSRVVKLHLAVVKSTCLCDVRPSGIITDYRLSQNEKRFRWWNVFNDMGRIWPVIILVWRKSIHFWRRYARNTIFTFSFPLPMTLTFYLHVKFAPLVTLV